MSVRPSVCPSSTFRGKRDFLGPSVRYRSDFFVQTPLINDHLFCTYFFRWSAGFATKGRNIKILKNAINILITKPFKAAVGEVLSSGIRQWTMN